MKQIRTNLKLICIIFLTFLVITISLVSCSTTEYRYPSITESATKTYNYGQVVWRDLVTPDPKKAAEFYKKVFGWQVDNLSKDDVKYWVFKNNGKPIAGMFLMPEKKSENGGGEWVGSISVPSVDNSATLTKANGGIVMIEPKEMNGRGKVVLLSDPQKAVFALIHSSKGDPVTSEPVENGWLWSENWSNNPKDAGNFYKTILNAQLEDQKDDNRDYTILTIDGKKTAGIIQNPADSVRSHWMQYILVSDVNLTTQKAKDAGAEILMAPDSTVRNGSVAIMLDPTGAPFTIQKWPVK